MRLATLQDIDELVDLGREMHAEIGFGPYIAEKVRANMIEPIVQAGAAIVIKEGGKIVASIGLRETTWDYNDERILLDRWFYVHHAYRKSGHARALLWFAKQASKMKGIPVVVSVGTTKDTMRKLKFFRKYMTPFGGSFILGADIK